MNDGQTNTKISRVLTSRSSRKGTANKLQNLGATSWNTPPPKKKKKSYNCCKSHPNPHLQTNLRANPLMLFAWTLPFTTMCCIICVCMLRGCSASCVNLAVLFFGGGEIFLEAWNTDVYNTLLFYFIYFFFFRTDFSVFVCGEWACFSFF